MPCFTDFETGIRVGESGDNDEEVKCISEATQKSVKIEMGFGTDGKISHYFEYDENGAVDWRNSYTPMWRAVSMSEARAGGRIPMKNSGATGTIKKSGSRRIR